ncbi:type II toxin-antitoxin system HicA family toxin [bacterium]|nr:type II toxin-antitoxin system HicA family toxin [bacterium]
MKVKEAIRLIIEDGWSQVKQRGSHRQFKHQFKSGRVTIAGHLNDDLPCGTLSSILKQAQIRRGKNV